MKGVTTATAATVLPPVDLVDQLDSNALIDLATAAAALHTRAMARLAMLARSASSSNENEDADRYVEAGQIATWLAVPLPYVYALIRQGELPAITFGKYKRVRVSAFRKWAADHQVEVPDYLRPHTRRDRTRPTTTRAAGRPVRDRRVSQAVHARADRPTPDTATPIQG